MGRYVPQVLSASQAAGNTRGGRVDANSRTHMTWASASGTEATLGYAYLLLLTLVPTGLTVAAGFSVYRIGYLGAKLTFVVGVLWLTVARSLWVRIPH